MGVDEDVGRNAKSCQGMVEPDQLLVAAPFRSERLGFHHDQIDIRALPLVAAPAGTKQDDLLRIDLVDDGLDHAIQKSFGHRLHQLIGAEELLASAWNGLEVSDE